MWSWRGSTCWSPYLCAHRSHAPSAAPAGCSLFCWSHLVHVYTSPPQWPTEIYSAVITCNKKTIQFPLPISQMSEVWSGLLLSWVCLGWRVRHTHRRVAGLVWCPCSRCSCSSNSEAAVQHRLEQGLMVPAHPHTDIFKKPEWDQWRQYSDILFNQVFLSSFRILNGGICRSSTKDTTRCVHIIKKLQQHN